MCAPPNSRVFALVRAVYTITLSAHLIWLRARESARPARVHDFESGVSARACACAACVNKAYGAKYTIEHWLHEARHELTHTTL